MLAIRRDLRMLHVRNFALQFYPNYHHFKNTSAISQFMVSLEREREIIGGLFDSFAARWINPEAPLPYPSGLRLMYVGVSLFAIYIYTYVCYREYITALQSLCAIDSMILLKVF